MDKTTRLRNAIELMPGKKWHDKVSHCASLFTRCAPNTVYRWLSNTRYSTDIPDEKLELIEIKYTWL